MLVSSHSRVLNLQNLILPEKSDIIYIESEREIITENATSQTKCVLKNVKEKY
jgi:hypothetical protein